jgi:hypothetical protein
VRTRRRVLVSHAPDQFGAGQRVKAVLALGKPTQATEKMYIVFDNQIATLDDVIQSDIEELKKKNRDINIKEWTAHAGTDQTGAPDYIMVNTEQLYAV